MSSATAKMHPGRKLLQAGLLVVISGVLFVATRAVPEMHGGAGTIAAVGFLLLAGTLMSELVEVFGIPHLTGYLLAGILAGPHVLHLIDHRSVERLSSVNTLALALYQQLGFVPIGSFREPSKAHLIFLGLPLGQPNQESKSIPA